MEPELTPTSDDAIRADLDRSSVLYGGAVFKLERMEQHVVALLAERDALVKLLSDTTFAKVKLRAMCKRMLAFGEAAVRAGITGCMKEHANDIVQNHVDLKALRELLAKTEPDAKE